MAALLAAGPGPGPAECRDEPLEPRRGLSCPGANAVREKDLSPNTPQRSVGQPAPDTFVQASFYRAADEGNLKLLKLGLESDGADINGRDKHNGWTALHYVAHRGHYRLVTYLLQVEGIVKDVQDLNGQTPADVARDHDIASLIGK
jgi:hypothetical protein